MDTTQTNDNLAFSYNTYDNEEFTINKNGELVQTNENGFSSGEEDNIVRFGRDEIDLLENENKDIVYQENIEKIEYIKSVLDNNPELVDELGIDTTVLDFNTTDNAFSVRDNILNQIHKIEQYEQEQPEYKYDYVRTDKLTPSF